METFIHTGALAKPLSSYFGVSLFIGKITSAWLVPQRVKPDDAGE